MIYFPTIIAKFFRRDTRDRTYSKKQNLSSQEAIIMIYFPTIIAKFFRRDTRDRTYSKKQNLSSNLGVVKTDHV